VAAWNLSRYELGFYYRAICAAGEFLGDTVYQVYLLRGSCVQNCRPLGYKFAILQLSTGLPIYGRMCLIASDDAVVRQCNPKPRFQGQAINL